MLAARQLATFREFSGAHEVLPLTWPALERAAQIWADLKRSGRLIGEVDILTAAVALESRMAVATRNTDHFRWIDGLVVENWAVSPRALMAAARAAQPKEQSS